MKSANKLQHRKPSHLLMIRPVNFGFNAETAVNNSFQVAEEGQEVQEKARAEFEYLLQLLTANDIDVTVMDDTPLPFTPDAVFPNNWISFHEGGIICLYPMFAPNRRQERKPGLIAALQKKFNTTSIIDFTAHEKHNRFLEGTGSMVLDRRFHIAYACLSPRTTTDVLDEFCRTMHFTPVVFNASDDTGSPIYHTNVMMCVTEQYVVICLESIPDSRQKKHIISTIEASGKEIIPITMKQMKDFAGNMLQVINKAGNAFVIMSSRAYQSLTETHVLKLEKYNKILHAPLYTIERNGGGSARCMIAEVYL